MFDLEKTKNTIQMLQSDDTENHTVALGILEQVPLEENIASVLYCIKYYRGSEDLIKENAPNLYKFLMEKFEGIDITLKMVFDCLVEMKPPVSQLEVYCSIFADQLSTQCKQMGYDFIEGIDIKVKLPQNV